MPTTVLEKSLWPMHPLCRLCTPQSAMVGQLHKHSQHPRLKSMCFTRWWVTFGEYFRWKGTIPSNPLLEWKDKRYPCFVWRWDIDWRLFRFVTIHASDRRTELWQQYRALHYMQRHSKNYQNHSVMCNWPIVWTHQVNKVTGQTDSIKVMKLYFYKHRS